MAVESDGEEMILVSADITMCEDWLLAPVRNKFDKHVTGVDAKKLREEIVEIKQYPCYAFHNIESGQGSIEQFYCPMCIKHI